MRTTQTMTVSLPPAMVSQFDKIRKAENRTRSELVREALRFYFSTRMPEVIPTKAELAAIRRGRAEIKKGDYITLDELLLNDLANTNRKASAKNSRKSSR